MKVNYFRLSGITIGSIVSMPISRALFGTSWESIIIKAIIITIGLYIVLEWLDRGSE